MLDETTGRAYCGAELAGPNGAAVLTCTACRHHRAALDAVVTVAAAVEADNELGVVAYAVDAVEHAEQVEAGVETVEDAEALFAAQLVTEADATDGTWRGAWIGEHQAADVLFALNQVEEQGALFLDRTAQ